MHTIAVNCVELLITPSNKAYRWWRYAFFLLLILLLLVSMPVLNKAVLVVMVCRLYREGRVRLQCYSGRLHLVRNGTLIWNRMQGEWGTLQFHCRCLIILRVRYAHQSDWIWLFADSCSERSFRHLSLLTRYPLLKDEPLA
ncbi:protein YgfX [Thaumasiovibrio sp. DFM-14]|uniref:protein YgfX n=1 Tax=Thaumasiovibrio sp. DFM-14 TaxID=3384792 RepID=UPI0039A2084D